MALTPEPPPAPGAAGPGFVPPGATDRPTPRAHPTRDRQRSRSGTHVLDHHVPQALRPHVRPELLDVVEHLTPTRRPTPVPCGQIEYCSSALRRAKKSRQSSSNGLDMCAQLLEEKNGSHLSRSMSGRGSRTCSEARGTGKWNAEHPAGSTAARRSRPGAVPGHPAELRTRADAHTGPHLVTVRHSARCARIGAPDHRPGIPQPKGAAPPRAPSRSTNSIRHDPSPLPTPQAQRTGRFPRQVHHHDTATSPGGTQRSPVSIPAALVKLSFRCRTGKTVPAGRGDARVEFRMLSREFRTSRICEANTRHRPPARPPGGIDTCLGTVGRARTQFHT